MKKFILTLIFVFTALPVFASTGFLSDQIWYSTDSLKEGETVKIYTAIWNGEDNPLYSKVEFYDKNIILGTRNVSIASQKLEEVSISWEVTSGDHVISAKILSSENGEVTHNTTKEDKVFVPVSVEKEDGEKSTNNELIKEELTKVGDKINDILPASVNDSISKGTDLVETFRDETLVKILSGKEKTENELLEYESYTKKDGTDTLESATEKPIAQVKLFFLKVLEFVFNNKIVFYGVIVLIIFLFFRAIYRKIRNR